MIVIALLAVELGLRGGGLVLVLLAGEVTGELTNLALQELESFVAMAEGAAARRVDA